METKAASYDVEARAVVINHLSVHDDAVGTEARRWASGARGEPETDQETLAKGDLTNFVTQALRLGSLAMTATGHAQDTFGLERLVREVGERTADSSTAAAELTARAAKDAAGNLFGEESEERRNVALSRKLLPRVLWYGK